MIGEYSCPFLCNTGKACGNPCIRPEGCRFHWKAKKRVPCSDCGKPTASACEQYPLHIRGTMLPDTIIDFDQKVFDQRCKKDFV